MGPKPSKSGYAEYFSDIDKGRKIFCFFVPGCEHCRHTAKELHALQKNTKIFQKYELFSWMKKLKKIPDFFAFVGTKFPYKVIDVIPFGQNLAQVKTHLVLCIYGMEMS